MERILALVGFAIVSSVTPGPNNLLLWASGAEFGIRRTVPHIVGTASGSARWRSAWSSGSGRY
jgi:threonine/homoserine/homoserine lactone efflux protein